MEYEERGPDDLAAAIKNGNDAFDAYVGAMKSSGYEPLIINLKIVVCKTGRDRLQFVGTPDDELYFSGDGSLDISTRPEKAVFSNTDVLDLDDFTWERHCRVWVKSGHTNVVSIIARVGKDSYTLRQTSGALAFAERVNKLDYTDPESCEQMFLLM